MYSIKDQHGLNAGYKDTNESAGLLHKRDGLSDTCSCHELMNEDNV